MVNGTPDRTGSKPRSVGTDVFDPQLTGGLNMSGNTDKDSRFNQLFAQLVSAITDINGVDVDKIENLLIELCLMFRLSKADTRVYKNPQEEAEGGGETLCCFDTGKEGNAVITLRTVTSVMTSATITAYMTPDEKPLDEDERQKVELVMRTILSFISRNRMRDVVYELAYFDELGYPNLRAWKDYLGRAVHEKKTANRIAFRYNLRHFSLINQEFGRVIGDVIMKSHFDGLKELIGEDGFAARLGGDNFLGMCSSDKIRPVVDYLTETEVRTPKGVGVNVSTSAGFFRIPGDHDSTADEIMAASSTHTAWLRPAAWTISFSTMNLSS